MKMGVQSKFGFPGVIGSSQMIRNDMIYILGASALGAASIAYILFGDSITPSSSSTKNSRFVRGLKNVKNNCFINAILQAFSSSDSMIAWLNLSKHQQEQNNQPSLIYQMASIVNAINSKCDAEAILSPEGVLNSLRQHRWVISNDEQDAFELFCVLTSTLDLESNRLSFMLAVRDILSDEVSINGIKSKTSATNKLLTRTSGLMNISSQFKNTLPTRGILSNHLTCQNCHSNYPIQLDIFDAVSLSLPDIELGTSILLESCLKKFVSPEQIEDFNCQYCKNKCTFIKRIGFAKLPQLLCLHLKRLVWIDGNRPFKRVDHVKFPEYLVMDPFKFAKLERPSQSNAGDQTEPPTSTTAINSEKRQKDRRYYHKYALSSVIVHLGDDNSGHYVCYRSKPDKISGKIKWYYISDLSVKEVTKTEVFSTSAYMLFYEKIRRINATL